MASDVMMPRLSDSMEEGTVLKWLVEQGAEVKRGEPLAEIETDKANMTYEADQEGTLIEIVAGEGDTVAIGEVIARLGEPGEASSGDGGGGDGGADRAEAEEGDDAAASAETEEVEEESGAAEGSETQAGGAEADGGGETEAGGDADAVRGESESGGEEAGEGNGRAKASPVARRMAEQKGIDLSALQGSGPGGRIVKADVEAAAGNGGAPEAGADGAAKTEEKEDTDGAVEQEEAHAPEAPPAEKRSGGEGGAKGGVETVDLSRLQKTVARRMSESKATAPDFQITVEVDMEACIALRGELRELSEKPPSYNDMVVKACAMALRDFPRANGAYRDGTFELYDRVNVGIAVSAMDALVVPTIFDADKKSLGEISRDSRGLAAKVRDGNIAPPELSGGTFTVSNLGMFGIDDMIPVINPPQAAILGVGAMRPRAVVDSDGRIVARNTMIIRLSTDHRILYGADAAEFLSRIRELLEAPMLMAL